MFSYAPTITENETVTNKIWGLGTSMFFLEKQFTSGY